MLKVRLPTFFPVTESRKTIENIVFNSFFRIRFFLYYIILYHESEDFMKYSGEGELSLKVYVKLSYYTELKYLGVLWDIRESKNESSGEDEIVIEYIDEERDLCGVWYKKKKVEKIEIHV